MERTLTTMMKSSVFAAVLLGFGLAAQGQTTLPSAPPDSATNARVIKAAAQIADELARLCPLAGAADQAAFDKCRAGLFRDSQFKRSLQSYVLWGRQRDVSLKLADS